MPDLNSFDHKVGHRQRMKKRLLESSSELLTDAEMLEMLLFFIFPRKDTKPSAKELLHKFGTLRTLLLSVTKDDAKELFKSETTLSMLKLIHGVLLRILKQEVIEKTVFSGWNAITEYLKAKFGSLDREQFSVMYLSNSNALIEMTEFGTGTIDASTVYSREIVKRAMQNSAVKIILSHNHPSDSVEPSREDIKTTMQIKEACKTVGIDVVDHIIVSSNKIYSFKANNLI